ncbi:ornithine carbamoyltransferase [Candidatus Nitronereus thalassa]|uniref:Ornithine carbamoyltransferase n=1 Tax=Candidatus Nitronereus thalassa TaxID=3020898 RepID=A0ABU3K9B7_9BACT|nr:ornithine carbamoyltransferase [Candidatus Nitronereus thalassa]MDT7043010.1 ornithine carbamoyltransferase [Candidatus Nitronereus thalassa]
MTILGHSIPKTHHASSSNPSAIGLGKDFLTLGAIPRSDILRLLQIARELKAAPRPGRASQWLQGLTLGLIFEKPSTRTRVSFEAGMNQLGGQALFLSSENIQLSRGESLADTALVLSRYLDGLVIRTFEQSTIEEWARHATIPVINGLTDLCHPCQALADLMTILEKKGSFQGLKLAYLGDGNNIANSLIEAGAKVGMHVAVGCPPNYAPDPSIVEKSREEARETGATIDITVDPAEAALHADVLYTDVWTSMGQEEEQAQRLTALAPYQLNEALLARAKPEAMVLHCLPAHRGEEITEGVIDGQQSAVLDQAENRLHVQKAILTEWLGRPWS